MIHQSHRRGSVCSAVLRTTDIERASAFYQALMAFTADHVPGTGGAVRLLRHEGSIVGLIQQSSARNEWVPFVSVDDVDAAVSAAASLGASLIEYAEVPGLARMATVSDPEGVPLGLWQPAPLEGVERTEDVGSLSWAEVLSNQPERATRFYSELFHWGHRLTAFEPFAAYTVFERDGSQEAGVLPIQPDWGVLPRWNLIYQVADCDRTMQRSSDLGGARSFVHTVPKYGRFGSIVDPNGALFCMRSVLPTAG